MKTISFNPDSKRDMHRMGTLRSRVSDTGAMSAGATRLVCTMGEGGKEWQAQQKDTHRFASSDVGTLQPWLWISVSLVMVRERRSSATYPVSQIIDGRRVDVRPTSQWGRDSLSVLQEFKVLEVLYAFSPPSKECDCCELELGLSIVDLDILQVLRDMLQDGGIART
ncbi:hypothetical protein B0H13DRAFT_1877273 [Mycena leptocephala]|nr:hypothetical protein B0H13DRAFT_1877273 [Mycena leptocephala]